MKSRAKTDPAPAVVLFRNDLRIADNGALAAAAETGRPILALFVDDSGTGGGRPRGGASRWWLHHSLTALSASLKALGVTLVLRRGEALGQLREIVETTGATSVYWNRRYDPAASEADRHLKDVLRDDGIEARSFDGALLHEPSLLKTSTGGFYKVYSPFQRALVAMGEPRDPIDAPEDAEGFSGAIDSLSIADLDLLPHHPDWAGGLRETWTPGEAGAAARLDEFLKDRLDHYAEERDVPDAEATSRLSPHLAFGEITPYRILAGLNRIRRARASASVDKFRKELAWRDFSYHLLFHNPDLHEANFNRKFDDFPWRRDEKALEAWRRGRTGYPIVDAGMRQLWQTGWMHNRVRMIVASVLVKHLLIDWREGERWFWDTLVDADPANNAASWQWVAGSGADAAPYFRVFNPVLQGEKFDPRGAYVRRFVPELAALPDTWIHKPWQAPAGVLQSAGVTLGKSYPKPLVDHAKARDRALAAFQGLKDGE